MIPAGEHSGRVLPVLQCRFFPHDPDWAKVEAAFLKDTVTGKPPVQATGFKAAWSEECLHVRFEAADDDAWGTLTRRDDPLYNEEVVEVFLDPVGDLESYFEIEVSPLNVVCDLVLRRTRSGYQKEFAWDCDGLQTEVTRSETGWVTQIAIPFSSLCPESPRIGSKWRANFFRIDRPRKTFAELSAWSPTGIRRFHIQQRFGVLEFVGQLR